MFLEHLYNALHNQKVKITNVNDLIIVNKIGLHNSEQFVWVFEPSLKSNHVFKGPCVQLSEANATGEIDAAIKMAAMIAEFSEGKEIRFNYLILPKHTIAAQQHRYNNVIGRYLKDYLVGTDSEIDRWDVLINKELTS